MRIQNLVAQSSRKAETQDTWNWKHQEKTGFTAMDTRGSSPHHHNSQWSLSSLLLTNRVISRILSQSKNICLSVPPGSSVHSQLAPAPFSSLVTFCTQVQLVMYTAPCCWSPQQMPLPQVSRLGGTKGMLGTSCRHSLGYLLLSEDLHLSHWAGKG